MKNNISININYIEEYKNIIENTNLQKGYQEIIKLFRYLKIYFEKEMPEFKFTSNIVENNMDYSYFQFTNDKLRENKLKIVFVFIHKDFKFQIWLSGINRNIQEKYFNIYKNTKYNLSIDPNKTDYILYKDLNFNYNNLEQSLICLKKEVYSFINDIINNE